MPQEDAIIAAVAGSPIFTYQWEDRGRAPKGYSKGMALAFAAFYADLTAADTVAAAMTVPVAADPTHDVFAWYADVLTAAGAPAPDQAPERLVQLFTILLGLGMRESSGKHCEGRDMSADNVSADSAEAGLFQVSRDSMGAHPLLQTLFTQYGGRTDLADTFAEGVHCSDSSWQNWGEGAGRDFQDLTKRCPKFAVAYAGVLLRHQRKHWGPINRKEAEIRPDALALFRQVKAIVDTGA